MVNVLKGYTTMVQHISSNDGVNNTCSIVLLIGFILWLKATPPPS